MRNPEVQLSCVARGDGFQPIGEVDFFIPGEPVHTGLFQKIGDSYHPVQNTDISQRVRTCVKRQRLPDLETLVDFRAIEDVGFDIPGEPHFIGVFTGGDVKVKEGPSMPSTLRTYQSIRHFEVRGKNASRLRRLAISAANA